MLLRHADRAEAEAVAHDLVVQLLEPIRVDDLKIHTDASVGVALYPDHGEDFSDLLRRADAAVYLAKQDGPVHVHGDPRQDERGDHGWVGEEFRAALGTGQLVLHYQPKVNLTTGTAVGVEALVRWDHPTRGLLYPDAFLRQVEEAGLMRALTEEVLRTALDQAATWSVAGRRIAVAVNLPASILVDVDLPAQISVMLAERRLPASSLELEITEESLMSDRARARTILSALRDYGVRIAVDDFGTGYSSLAYLRDLPIDELKLDRSFVMPMSDDPRAVALVSSVTSLAHSIGLLWSPRAWRTGTRTARSPGSAATRPRVLPRQAAARRPARGLARRARAGRPRSPTRWRSHDPRAHLGMGLFPRGRHPGRRRVGDAALGHGAHVAWVAGGLMGSAAMAPAPRLHRAPHGWPWRTSRSP